MPKIRITGRLPKALLGFEVTTTTTLGPNITYDEDSNPKINFTRTTGGLDENAFYTEKELGQTVPQKKWDPFAGEPIMNDSDSESYNAMNKKQQKKFDKGLLGKQDTKESLNSYNNWYYNKYPTIGMKAYKGLEKVANTKAFKFADKWGHNIEKGAYIAQPFVDYINDKKAQKNWDKWFKESALPDNMYSAKSASATGNRGDWDINTGIFRPNEIGFKSKGQYTNYFQAPGNTVAYGGTPINENDMQKIKIRITGSSQPKMYMGGDMYSPDQNMEGQKYTKQNLESFRPFDANEHLSQNISNLQNQMSMLDKRYDYMRKSNDDTTEKMATGGQPMKYTGQMGYGINLGQKRIYTDMPGSKSDSASKTLQPVARNKANIEAESGETAWGDLDNDGALEHMQIGGKRHTEGGTPLNVPEGTFIFSDTKNMTIKDENVLKMFSMPANKKGYTPAQIAKKYDINTYKAIIEDPAADEMRKATAQLMVKTYQKKLAQLSLIQEQMKGFPQGIPDVAKKVMPELNQMQQGQQQGAIPQQEDNQQMQAPQQQMPQGQEQLPENGMAYGGNYYAKNGLAVTTNTTKKPTADQAMANSKNFMQGWMNSPMYMQMLNKSDPNSTYINSPFSKPIIVGDINTGRQLQLDNIHFTHRKPTKKEAQEGTAAFAQSGMPFHSPMAGPAVSWRDGDQTYPALTFLDYKENQGDDINSDAVHETSHATDYSGYFIPDADLAMMNKFRSGDYKSSPMYKRHLSKYGTNAGLNDPKWVSKKNEWLDYVNDPTETRARLNDFRFRAKEQGIYDPFTQKFDLKYLKNYKPIPSGDSGSFDPINQLRDSYSDEEIQTMLNSISKTKGNANSDQAKYGGTSPLGMYATGGGADPTTTTTVNPNGIYDQTVSPDKTAALDDKEYPTLIGLLDKLAKKSNGTYYLSSLKSGEQKELSRLITKFGLSHVDEIINNQKVAGYKLSQNSTPGYTWSESVNNKKQKVGFFGGMTPELYEDKVIESIYPADQVAKMTPVQKRRLYFKELGIDDTKFKDADLADTKKLYTDKNFFKNTFYPAFTKTFGGNDYRKIKGDDWQIGLEHYDAYKWKAPAPGTTTTAQPGKFVCTENGPAPYNPAIHANLTPYDSYAAAQQVCYKEPGTLIPPVIKKPPFKYMTPDLVNMAAAAAIPPKKYLPWSPQLPFEPGDVVFEDWRAKAAERQSVMNKMMNQMNTYSPGSATASNLSFLAGQGSEGLIKDIADVDARNVNTANQFSQQEIGRRDKNNAANLGRAEELYKGNVIANQQYDNSKRAYINNMAKTFGQAWKNRMQLGLLNNVNTMYPVDPITGYSYYTGGKGTNNFNGGSGGSDSYSAKDMQTLKAQFISYGYSDKAAEDAALKLIDGTSGKSKDDNKPNMADYKFD